MTKKTTSGAASPDGMNPTRETLNEIYTAHQVHTLAQLTFQRMAAGRQFPATGYATPWSAPAGARAFAPGNNPAFLYWYP